MHFIKWGTWPLSRSHKVTEELCDRVAIQNSLPWALTTTSLMLSLIISCPTKRNTKSPPSCFPTAGELLFGEFFTMVVWQSTGLNGLWPDSYTWLIPSRFRNAALRSSCITLSQRPHCVRLTGDNAAFLPEHLLLGTQGGINGYHMSCVLNLKTSPCAQQLLALSWANG